MGHFDDGRESVTLLMTPGEARACAAGLHSLLTKASSCLDAKEMVCLESLLVELREAEAIQDGQDIRKRLRESGDPNLIRLAETLADEDLSRLRGFMSEAGL